MTKFFWIFTIGKYFSRLPFAEKIPQVQKISANAIRLKYPYLPLIHLKNQNKNLIFFLLCYRIERFRTYNDIIHHSGSRKDSTKTAFHSFLLRYSNSFLALNINKGKFESVSKCDVVSKVQKNVGVAKQEEFSSQMLCWSQIRYYNVDTLYQSSVDTSMHLQGIEIVYRHIETSAIPSG